MANPDTTPLTIALESPRQPEIVALIAALDRFNDGLYPPEASYLLSLDELDVPDIRFLVARLDGQAVGCGALWVHAGDYGEVKRMFASPAVRGRGIGHRILAEIERLARAEDLAILRLETGNLSNEALKLYRRAGFEPRGPFGDYADHAACVFMEKRLG